MRGNRWVAESFRGLLHLQTGPAICADECLARGGPITRCDFMPYDRSP
jgi:hypothetical protein